MNRRNFLKNSALALFGFTVLPPAETYQRIWKAQRINPTYVNAEYEFCFIMDANFLESCRKNLLYSGIPIEKANKVAERWTNEGGVGIKVFDRTQFQA